MKRKIAGAILISLGLGFLWQALVADKDYKNVIQKDTTDVRSSCEAIRSKVYEAA